MSQSPPVPFKCYSFFRRIFDKCDVDKDGFITVAELSAFLNRGECEDIPFGLLQRIHDMHDQNKDRKLDFDEFCKMVRNPRLRNIFGRYMTSYVKFVVPRRRIRSTSVEDYENVYTCSPPAVGMILVSLVEVIICCFDVSSAGKPYTGPVSTLLVYQPQRRRQIWRYFSYMFVHCDAFHLTSNVLVQILLAIPLEMVHKWWRVLLVYIAGVLAGSLGSSVIYPLATIGGASGGVWSLLTAHVACIIMNWKDMSYPFVQLLIFVIFIIADISAAITQPDRSTSYAAHCGGAIAGLLVGIQVMRNLRITRIEKFIWWFSIVTYSVLMVICIVWNLAFITHFPKQNYD